MEKTVLYENIDRLVQYGLTTGLTSKEEEIYTRNQLLEVFGEEDYQENDKTGKAVKTEELEDILKNLLDYAAEAGLLKENSTVYRDLFDTRLMNCLLPRPSEVSRNFQELYRKSPEEATNYYYKFAQDSDYIRRYRIARDIRWVVPSVYGDIDISINLSKPEKDPKAIAAAKRMKQSSYPKCQLCKENMGYAGRVNHPARQNHRIIPLKINQADWFFQYSPYVYYNEHCIVFCGEHVPMKIERATFVKLFDFIKLFPHYFLGSNADLPIVGGSILTHDHYQGGNNTFAMAKAPIRCKDETRLIDLAEHILNKWRGYTDEEAFVFAETDGEPHNTITPIARKVGDTFELDLALRNNITTEEYPLGVYHPHQDCHHIKKENIGLIEVMGLAILPARLKKEMELLKDYILNQKDIRSNADIEKHADWVEEFLKKEVGKVFVRVLEDAGVYKCTPEGREAFGRFIKTL